MQPKPLSMLWFFWIFSIFLKSNQDQIIEKMDAEKQN